MLTFFLWFFQLIIVDDKGAPLQLVGEGQDFMACIIGAIMCGLGLGWYLIITAAQVVPISLQPLLINIRTLLSDE